MSDATYNLNGGFKPTTKRFADLDGPDFFPTPPWATFALIENETFSGEIWECACGDGTMSRVLAETGQAVRSTDLYDRGFGQSGVDFLAAQSGADNIVTNPPYNCAESFVGSGVRHAKRKFALLLRLAFLEGATGPERFSPILRRPECGCSVSVLPFIQAELSQKVAAPQLMLGSFGTNRRLAQPN